MSSAVAPNESCGCCKGLAVVTPAEVSNAPGLDAVLYRVGRHSQFKRSMLAGLSLSRSAALRQLTARGDDDFAIALIDAWATVADVLTFYQERYANESYVRTATERRSLLELARAIGYELRPGVAVDVDLAFTIDGSPGSPAEATIPIGTRGQSVPGPGELAQTFETVEAISARAAWNDMKVRLGTRIPLTIGLDHLYLAGVETGLRKGDLLLVVTEDTDDALIKTVTSVETQSEVPAQPPGALQPPVAPRPARTLVGLDPADPTPNPPLTFSFPSFSSGRSDATEKYLGIGQISSGDFMVASFYENFYINQIFMNIAATQPPPPSVRTFRVRAPLFGHNAPPLATLPSDIRPTGRDTSWADNDLAAWLAGQAGEVGAPPDDNTIFLDSSYPSIVKGSYIVLIDGTGDSWDLFQVLKAADVSAADFAITGRVTQLTLNKTIPAFGIRSTVVYAQSEELAVTLEPDDSPVESTSIDLATWVDGLYEGQRLIVCGELIDNLGNRACEVATIDTITAVVEEGGGFARITFKEGLTNSYVRPTVSVFGNVAKATHGESKAEVLGSGDASQSYQRFPLRQPPLTQVRAKSASGRASTLSVYVNKVRWHEVLSLFGSGPTDRVYVTRTDNDGKTVVQFGDGLTGARVTSGIENVEAAYRSGIGLDALVKRGQVSLLLTRPSGVTGVVNPMDANGGEDPEVLEDAKRNAPLTVVSLDRIVSLRDFEDFTRAYTGIAKALATWTWDGHTRGVFITVAGPRGAEIPAKSNTEIALIGAIREAGDPKVPVRVASYQPRYFLIGAAVRIHPDYQRDVVIAAVDKALHERFSFESREFGQPVTQGEVIAAIQRVPGIVSVDLNVLDLTDPDSTAAPILQPHLTAALPEAGASGVPTPAELLMLDPRPVELEVLA
jgi:hypothetical protein